MSVRGVPGVLPLGAGAGGDGAVVALLGAGAGVAGGVAGGSGAGDSQALLMSSNSSADTRVPHWIFRADSFMMGRQYKGKAVMEILSWFLVEALAATALVGLVVWWTWPRPPKDDEPQRKSEPPKS